MCKEWIVPQNLIKAQGYYEGKTKIWLPKALTQNKVSRKPLQEEGSQQEIQSKTLKMKQQITVSSSGLPKEQKGKWVLKTQPNVQVLAQSTKGVQLSLDKPPKRATWQEKGKWVSKPSSI